MAPQDGEDPGEDPGEDRAASLAVELARRELSEFDRHFARSWSDGMAAKLGLREIADERLRELAAELLELLAEGRVDYTVAFRRLTDAAVDRARVPAVRDLLAGAGEGSADRRPRAEAWLRKWAMLDPRPDSMLAANPITIPRNHLLAEALDAATDGDLAPFNEMLDAVTHPFETRAEWRRFAEPPAAGSGRFVSYCGT